MDDICVEVVPSECYCELGLHWILWTPKTGPYNSPIGVGFQVEIGLHGSFSVALPIIRPVPDGGAARGGTATRRFLRDSAARPGWFFCWDL